jgi:hypothetical protein
MSAADRMRVTWTRQRDNSADNDTSSYRRIEGLSAKIDQPKN